MRINSSAFGAFEVFSIILLIDASYHYDITTPPRAFRLPMPRYYPAATLCVCLLILGWPLAAFLLLVLYQYFSAAIPCF